MFRRALSLATVACLTATSASPCAFHGYTPQATFVERLLGSDHIVLARPTPQDPFRYAEVDVLEGDDAYVDIPQLVDSGTRRRLAANPEDRVLFARDGAYGPWQRIAYVNRDMERVLRAVMQQLPAWEMGGDPERFAFFASLLNHPDKAIHALALRELDMADYGLLKSVALNVEAERLSARLNLRSEADLKPIRILLLGLSDEQIAEGFFEAGVEGNIRFSGGILGAYATAMIEHGGPASAVRLVNRHLMNQALPALSREMLIEALAIHSSAGDENTREAIRVAVGLAIGEDPGLAPMVARQFGARYDWSQRDAIEAAMRGGGLRSPIEILLLSHYLSLAAESGLEIQN